VRITHSFPVPGMSPVLDDDGAVGANVTSTVTSPVFPLKVVLPMRYTPGVVPTAAVSVVIPMVLVTLTRAPPCTRYTCAARA
jgi:hypothetical protein